MYIFNILVANILKFEIIGVFVDFRNICNRNIKGNTYKQI